MDPSLKSIGCNVNALLLSAFRDYCHSKGQTVGGSVEKLLSQELAAAGITVQGFVPQTQSINKARVRVPNPEDPKEGQTPKPKARKIVPLSRMNARVLALRSVAVDV